MILILHWSETSVREYVFYVFFRFQKREFYVFKNMTYQKVVKSHNQVPSLLNVYRNCGLKTPGCDGYLNYLYAFITHMWFSLAVSEESSTFLAGALQITLLLFLRFSSCVSCSLLAYFLVGVTCNTLVENRI